MEDIRRRSGASTGSIYHHFKSKEQLATAVYLEGIADYQAGFMSQLDRSSSAKKGIASVIRYHLRWVEEHTEWAHYLFQMRHADFMAAAEEDIVEQNRQYYLHMQHWLDARYDAGELRSLPFEIVFSLIIFPCFNFARLWLSGQVETDLDSAGRILADAAWRSLKAE
jgi:AcrR family transcriptional regulator